MSSVRRLPHGHHVRHRGGGPSCAATVLWGIVPSVPPSSGPRLSSSRPQAAEEPRRRKRTLPEQRTRGVHEHGRIGRETSPLPRPRTSQASFSPSGTSGDE